MNTATSARARLLAISLLALLGLSLAGGSAQAQIQPNHYKVYITAEQPLVNLTVLLIDQFTTPTDNPLFVVERLTRFANPVSKNGEFVPDTTAHLTWWEIRGKELGRQVVVDNQFGEQVLITGDARYLLAPALKDPANSPGLPIRNHYKCYDAIGAPPGSAAGGIQVRLDDQFGTETVTVDSVEIFCNPVDKNHAGKDFPIVDPLDHLVCYRILPPENLMEHHLLIDQFGPWRLTAVQPIWLCVPSLKTGVTQAEGSTWGKVKSYYR